MITHTRSSETLKFQQRDTTVFLIEDNPTVLKSLEWLVQSVGVRTESHCSAIDFLASVDSSRPGCLVTDVRLPQMSGLDLLIRIQTDRIPRPVIVLTGHGDVPLAVKAMRCGAFDFLEKPCNDHLLLERVQQAIESDHMNRKKLTAKSKANLLLEKLSERERQVFLLILNGFANKEIAGRLDLSIKTIESHRAKLCQKLDIDHAAGFVRLATLAGIDFYDDPKVL